jgi:hypothetical protein
VIDELRDIVRRLGEWEEDYSAAWALEGDLRHDSRTRTASADSGLGAILKRVRSADRRRTTLCADGTGTCRDRWRAAQCRSPVVSQ